MDQQKESIHSSETYQKFFSQVAQLRLNVSNYDDIHWKYYDFGPKDRSIAPLIFIPSTTGTAESYYLQVFKLGQKGYRVISVQPPPYLSHEKWVKSFDRFVDSLKVDKVHLFGASLGGYLAQCYIQYRPNRVKSLILCNSFCDNDYFANRAPCLSLLSWMPDFMIRNLVLSNLPQSQNMDDSVLYMIDQMKTLTQEELVSRITLNYKLGPLVAEDLPIPNEAITIMDALDAKLIPDKLKHEVYKFYPGSKQALLKDGGDFPFLSRSDEVNMYIEVHLRANGYPVYKHDNDEV